MSNCKYYYVTTKPKALCQYFKYTRSIEHFENDDLFEFLKITSKEFIDFLEQIKHTKTPIKILYYVWSFNEAMKILKLSDSLSPNIKIFCSGWHDWWRPARGDPFDAPPRKADEYILNAFRYNRIKYVVYSDYKTLGSFLNIDLEKYKENIVSWNYLPCYENSVVKLNDNPINKILVSGTISAACYPERYKLSKFDNVCIKKRGNNVWTDEKAYSQYLNKYICCFSSSNYPLNFTTRKYEISNLILLKTYEILGSGSLLLSPLNQKIQLAEIGLIEDVNCMLVDMSDDNKIKEKIDFILDEKNRKLIDNIRKKGQKHGINNLSSKRKYEILRKLIINSDTLPTTDKIVMDKKDKDKDED